MANEDEMIHDQEERSERRVALTKIGNSIWAVNGLLLQLDNKSVDVDELKQINITARVLVAKMEAAVASAVNKSLEDEVIDISPNELNAARTRYVLGLNTPDIRLKMSDQHRERALTAVNLIEGRMKELDLDVNGPLVKDL